MVAQFRSIGQALVLLAAVPFAFTGAVMALLLTGTPMSVSGGIGLLMLIGIVVTNTIVLIDLVNQYRRRGLSVAEAVVEGGRLRVRPIVMTAISTVGALTPIALGLGSSSMLIAQSLAIVTIGGLVSSTLLSLAIIPALYTILEETKQRWSERRGRRGKGRQETTRDHFPPKPQNEEGLTSENPADEFHETAKGSLNAATSSNDEE